MPVGNRFTYWDGTAWVPHVAAVGDRGPVGLQGPPMSVGACAFTGSIAALPTQADTLITNLAVAPAFTDKEPCLTVKSPTLLQVARPGTIMFSVFILVGGGVYVPTNGGTSYVEVISSAHGLLSAISWTMNWSDANGVADIYPNMLLGYDLKINVRLALSAATAPISCKITAAVTA